MSSMLIYGILIFTRYSVHSACFTRTSPVIYQVVIGINNAENQCVKQYNKVAKWVIILQPYRVSVSVWCPRLTYEHCEHVPGIEAGVHCHSLGSSAGDQSQGIFIVTDTSHSQTNTVNVTSLNRIQQSLDTLHIIHYVMETVFTLQFILSWLASDLPKS